HGWLHDMLYNIYLIFLFFFFSSRRRHTRSKRDWSSDVCSSDLDSLTKYLGATTKGSKTEKNMTAQPFSEQKAHRRAFTLKGAYMSQVARRIMGDQEKDEKVIQDDTELEKKTFEEVVLEKFQPFIGQSKNELAEYFDVDIPKRNDKASS